MLVIGSIHFPNNESIIIKYDLTATVCRVGKRMEIIAQFTFLPKAALHGMLLLHFTDDVNY